MPDMNMQTYEELQRHQLVTEFDLQSQSELTDYQIKLDSVDNPTQAQDNLVVNTDGTPLPHWNESINFDTWVKMNIDIGSKRGLLIHGNTGLSNESSIDNTFIFGDDFPTGTLDTTNKWIIESGSPSITDGILYVSSARVWNKNDISPDVILEMRNKIYAAAGVSTSVHNGFATYTSIFIPTASKDFVINLASSPNPNIPVGISSVTAMYCQPYYDENGVYKCDDRNTTTTEYTCSNGHMFTVKS